MSDLEQRQKQCKRVQSGVESSRKRSQLDAQTPDALKG